MPKPSIGKRLFSFIFSEAAWQAFLTYAAPPLMTIATAVAGLTEHQPVMWVLVGASIAFAMTSFGLLAFAQWRFKRTPEHKLAFVTSAMRRVTTNLIVMGASVANRADFPVEVVVKSLNCSVSNRIPGEKCAVVGKPLLIDAGNTFAFTTPVIDVTGITDDPMIGDLEATIEYGRAGRRNFSYSVSQVLKIPLDETLPFISSAKLRPNDLTTT